MDHFINILFPSALLSSKTKKVRYRNQIAVARKIQK